MHALHVAVPLQRPEPILRRRILPERGTVPQAKGEWNMTRTSLATAALLALLSAPAFAQTTVVTPEPGATVTIAPEQRTRIKEYVVQQRVRPARIEERVTVGGTLPADVELSAVPSDWGPSVSRYRYVYSNDRVMLVDPSTRRVIQIID
jgi:uncharacterized protein DUF1236